jgi:hypothetical protein
MPNSLEIIGFLILWAGFSVPIGILTGKAIKEGMKHGSKRTPH